MEGCEGRVKSGGFVRLLMVFGVNTVSDGEKGCCRSAGIALLIRFMPFPGFFFTFLVRNDFGI